jgi:hypothetical protein
MWLVKGRLQHQSFHGNYNISKYFIKAPLYLTIYIWHSIETVFSYNLLIAL